MKKILNDYVVNAKTMALLAVDHWEYSTIVQEVDEEFYVKQTPLQLIKEACLTGGATYEGRRAAVVAQTRNRHKVPIPIHIEEQIYAFPTTSPKQPNCHWLFYQHIASSKINSNQASQSIITFRNTNQLKLDISHYIIEKQMHRTAYCISRFTYFNHRFVTTYKLLHPLLNH